MDYCKKVVVIAALMICFLVYTSVSVIAASEAAVTANAAEGTTGETVGVTVSIRGIGSLSGVEGISGGQFELVYDNTTVSVDKINPGSLIGKQFTFMSNDSFSNKSLKVVWASSSGLIKTDGDLCNITFNLKKDATVNPVLKNLILYDQDVRPIEIGTESSGNSDGNTVVLNPPGSDPENVEDDPGPDQTMPGGFNSDATDTFSGYTGSGETGATGEAAHGDNSIVEFQYNGFWLILIIVLVILFIGCLVYLLRRYRLNK